MKQMFSFTVLSQVIMEHEQGAVKSTLKETNLRLELSKNLQKSMYLDENDLPKKEAIKPITMALIHGIMTNIKLADKEGWWKEADHIKYVIDEINRAFTDVAYSKPNIVEGLM